MTGQLVQRGSLWLGGYGRVVWLRTKSDWLGSEQNKAAVAQNPRHQQSQRVMKDFIKSLCGIIVALNLISEALFLLIELIF
jgi:hypothetical protein